MAIVHALNMKQNAKRGFALFISVIFMSVMLSIGLTLASLGFKQKQLASIAVKSQYAFYAADSALECVLYFDQQKEDANGDAWFDYDSHTNGNPPGAVVCGGASPDSPSYNRNALRGLFTQRIRLNKDASGVYTQCADVSVYKYKVPNATRPYTTYIFSQGYNVPCSVVSSPAGALFTARGLQTQY